MHYLPIFKNVDVFERPLEFCVCCLVAIVVLSIYAQLSAHNNELPPIEFVCVLYPILRQNFNFREQI